MVHQGCVEYSTTSHSCIRLGKAGKVLVTHSLSPFLPEPPPASSLLRGWLSLTQSQPIPVTWATLGKDGGDVEDVARDAGLG